MDALLRLKHCCGVTENAILTRSRLRPAEYLCMRSLPVSGHIGSGELAGRMHLSPSRASRIVDALVKRRLVSREVDPRDRRALRLRFTETGRRLRDEIEDCLAACDRNVTSRLSPPELEAARTGVSVLLAAMEQE